jgi:hypothetical protein
MNRLATGALPNLERLALKGSNVTRKYHKCEFIIQLNMMVANQTVKALFAGSLAMKLG